MIAVLRRLIARARPRQSDAVALATLLDDREKLRQERDGALAARASAEAEMALALRRFQAEFEAAERYIAERDRAERHAEQLRASQSFWMAECDRLNRLLAIQGVAQRGGIALSDCVVVLAEFRSTKPGAVPFHHRPLP